MLHHEPSVGGSEIASKDVEQERRKTRGWRKYIVTLIPQEPEQPQSLAGKGEHAAQKGISALILLNCDQFKTKTVGARAQYKLRMTLPENRMAI